jgi:hypothetical protein
MTNANHPTDLALERHLLDPAASPVAPHLAGCDACRARVARMEEEGQRFRQFVYPATVDRIEAAAAGRKPARWWLAVLAPVAAAAAAVVAVVVLKPAGPAGPGADYVGLKGAPVALAAFVKHGAGAAEVADGAAVAPAEALRLRVRTAAPCRLFVLSVDGRGAVSRLDAGGPAGTALDAGQHDLPGGVELDGAPGPERLFAVCAPPKVAWPDVEKAAHAAGGGADQVRRSTSLGALPAGTTQATLLLEKTP